MFNLPILILETYFNELLSLAFFYRRQGFYHFLMSFKHTNILDSASEKQI